MNYAFFFGPGYRVYYTIHGTIVVLVLAGGDKFTQQKDIRAAKNMLKEQEVINSTFWGVRNSHHYPSVANLGSVSSSPQ
mgnify:CR=1 FL=1